MAIVFQQYNLFQNMTVLENVTVAPIKIKRRPRKEVEAYAIELLEKVGMGAVQDALRADGYRVIGGSLLGDRLEYNRALGQEVLRQAGLPIAETRTFDTAADAATWLRANPGRVVLKHDNNARATFVGDHRDGADVLFRLTRAPAGRRRSGPSSTAWSIPRSSRSFTAPARPAFRSI